MSVVVLAYQEIGYVCLEALLGAGADVSAVFTHEDDPEEERWFRSVADLAESHGIPIRIPDNPNTPEVIEQLKQLAPEFIFSFYYRHMLSADFLAAASKGAYNLHGSLLPKYRGRVPVNWSIINGETETGVTLHRMVVRADAGAIVASAAVPIEETDTAADVYKKLAPAAAELIHENWPKLAAGLVREIPQDESKATKFGRRGPADGMIDWNLSAKQIHDLVRAVTHPYPGAFTFLNDRKLFVWSSWYDMESSGKPPGAVLESDGEKGLIVAAKRGRLHLRAAQWDGEKELSGAAIGELNLAEGDRLG